MDLFDNVETRRINEVVKKGFHRATAAELADVLTVAKRFKPAQLESVSCGAQLRYRGRQKDIVEQKLKARFPETKNMPVSPSKWLKMFATRDSGVYVVESDRWLDDEKGARIPLSDPRGKIWSWGLKKARFHARMIECERRAITPPGVVVGHVVWVRPPGSKVGKPRIDLYWPHDVFAICHPDAPTTFEYAYVVILRQAAPDGSRVPWYRVYSRAHPDDIEDESGWGPWSFVTVSSKGEQKGQTVEPVPYKGMILPVFLVQVADAEGYVFALEDPDLLDVVDELNVQRSNELFVSGLQGHDQMWVNDATKEGAELAVGPDKIIQLNTTTAQAGLLSPNPKLSDMRAGRKQLLEEEATAHGNAPSAYVTKASGPPQSGTAMRIENVPHDDRIAEQAILFQAVEEDEFGPLAILKDVLVTFHPDGDALKDCTPRMTPRKRATIEEPDKKQQRLSQAKKEGWIDDARGATEMEFYPDEETAAGRIKEIAAAKTKEAPPADDDEDTGTDDLAVGEEGEGDDPDPENEEENTNAPRTRS